jgi:hypothetical protein
MVVCDMKERPEIPEKGSNRGTKYNNTSKQRNPAVRPFPQPLNHLLLKSLQEAGLPSERVELIAKDGLNSSGPSTRIESVEEPAGPSM